MKDKNKNGTKFLIEEKIMENTLSLNGGLQQSQSSSCDDLVSNAKVVVLSQQNLSNLAFVPAIQK